MENSNQAPAAATGKFLDEKKKAALVAAMSGLGNAVFGMVIVAAVVGLGQFGAV